MSQLLSGTAEASRKKAVNTTNKICFVHLVLGKNCTATLPAPPSTPKQDPKCKTSGSSLVREPPSEPGGIQGSWEREKAAAPPPLSFWKTWSLSRKSPSPSASFYFPVTQEQHFHSLVFPSTSANIPLCSLYSSGLGHGTPAWRKREIQCKQRMNFIYP